MARSRTAQGRQGARRNENLFSDLRPEAFCLLRLLQPDTLDQPARCVLFSLPTQDGAEVGKEVRTPATGQPSLPERAGFPLKKPEERLCPREALESKCPWQMRTGKL
jgi:hypothetical protein